MIKDNDLIVATHGRGFWILDDIDPLREFGPEVTAADAHLFAPGTATRVRWDMNTDTPLPPDEPAGENPPDGTVLTYWLGRDAAGPVVLEVLDGSGAVVRRYASTDPVEEIDPNLAVPTYWVRPAQRVSTKAGLHRFVWDLHWTPLPGGRGGLPMTAIAHNTVPTPTGPWVMPGDYTVRLTVSGKSYTQSLTVRMDPRMRTPEEGLRQQFALSKALYDGALEAQAALDQLRSIREQVADRRQRAAQGSLADALKAFDTKAEALEGSGGGGFRRGFGGGGDAESLNAVIRGLGSLLGRLQASDVTPMPRLIEAAEAQQENAERVLARWKTLRDEDLPRRDAELERANLPAIALPK